MVQLVRLKEPSVYADRVIVEASCHLTRHCSHSKMTMDGLVRRWILVDKMNHFDIIDLSSL